ncbi:MAG: serine/threonine-protein kinase [Leptolyngbyaceae bacterium]|nr:serine/threonine-protein kinase [Leptolyngbyaceae bacterium]
MSAMIRSSTSVKTVGDSKFTSPQIGSLVGGRYCVTCRLSEGTFGHTYLAKDTHLPNSPECVIKQLKLQTNEKAMKMARRLFNTEASTLYELGNHNQIPQLLAHFEQNDEFFLSLEYIEGYPISDELSPDRPWADVNVVRLIREILEVLAFVHDHRVIHRDIKPSNLIRRKQDGKVVLIDFGAVKQVTTGFLSSPPGQTDYTIAIGTFGYIAKEQLGGRPRFSSDIFSVGMIAVQALTGVHPNDLMEDDRTAEIQWRDRLTAPVNPQFAAIIDRMIRYDFRERYANAQAALRAIEALPVAFREAAAAPPWHTSPIHLSSVNPLILPTTDSFESKDNRADATTFRPRSSPASVPSSAQAPVPPSVPPSAPPSVGQQMGDRLDSTQIESHERYGHHFSQSNPDESTFPLEHTHMTDVVAPSFSDTRMETSAHPHPLIDEQGFGYEQAHFPASLTSQEPLPRTVITWKDRVLATSDHFEHWLSRSWRVIALIGGTSLTLMLTRGMMASFAPQPAHQLRADVSTNVVSKARHFLNDLPAEPTDIPIEEPPTVSTIDIPTVLDEAHRARIEGRYQEAMDFYRQALGQEPSLVDALWGKCATHNAQGRFEMASAACYEVLAIDPEHPLALWSSAEANDQLGNHKKAAEERNRALSIDPNVSEKLSNAPAE